MPRIRAVLSGKISSVDFVDEDKVGDFELLLQNISPLQTSPTISLALG
jgi:hypothetical protein